MQPHAVFRYFDAVENLCEQFALFRREKLVPESLEITELGSGQTFALGLRRTRQAACFSAEALRDGRDQFRCLERGLDLIEKPRAYLGGSRVGEPCARRLVYEYLHTSMDEGKDFDGRILRVFDAGHKFEDLSVAWLRLAGFDLRTNKKDGQQFGFSAANGKLAGHIDGVIVAGPEVGIAWPALWEHKALNAKSWNDLVKHGLQVSKPVYFGQVQLYMAYMELSVTLFTALNKDTEELYHEVVPFDPAEAQTLSDKGVTVIPLWSPSCATWTANNRRCIAPI